MNYSFAHTALLVAAIRVRIFTYLAQGYQTAIELAECIGSEPTSVTRFLAALKALGLIEQTGEQYQLTPLAQAFLVEGRPGYLGGDTLAMLDYLPAWFELDKTLRTGEPYRDLGDASTAEAFFAPRVRELFGQIHGVARRVVAELEFVWPDEGPLQVLDIGAGSAPWSAALALRHETLHVTAMDLPAVAEQGRQHIVELGLDERYTWIAADMEKAELPVDCYDVIILAHVSRFISDQRVQMLLSRLVKSLRTGGTLIIADIFFNDERTGPISLDISMLVNTSQGRIRTCGELISWLDTCGLSGVQAMHIAGPFPIVIGRKEVSIE